MPRLYDDLAWLWPLLSPPSDYEGEAAAIAMQLERHFAKPMPGARLRVLELGAGGGHTLYHLADQYDCTAVDLSAGMLTNCQMLNPDVTCVQGDMRDVTLDQTFHAVLIHDAVDYLTSEADLAATFANVHRHLEPGGLLLVAPTYTSETFSDHQTAHDQQSHGPLVLTYVSYICDPDPTDTTFEMLLVYLIHEDGNTRVVEDRHTCGLFSEARWQALLHEAGFTLEPELVEQGDDDPPFRMFVAAKPSA